MKLVRKIAVAIIAFAVMLGSIALSAPANADDKADTTSVVSVNAVPPEATIYAKAATATDITAKADSVSIAGANAMGKLLLEEEKTQSPIKAIRNFKPPSYDEAKKYGVWVYSIQDGQQTLTELVAKYDQIVKKARVKVAKLELRIKHKDGNVKKLKKKLKKAEKHLKFVRTSWSKKPMIRLGEGTCGLNSGRLDNLELQPFSFCVGEHNDLVEVVMAWVPEIREVVIAIIVHADGTVEVGCFNIGGFDVPPGAPNESMVLVLKAFAQAVAKVGLWYNSNVVLTVGGVLTCPSGIVIRDEKTVTKASEPQYLYEEVTSPRSVKKVIEFGEGKAKTSVSAKAHAEAQVSATYTNQVGATLTLKCPNQPPTGEIVKYDQHQYAGGITKWKIVVTDPEDGANVDFDINDVVVTGGASLVLGNPDYPVIRDVEGTQVVLTFYVRAGQVSDINATLTATATDSQGATWSDSKTWPIVEPPW